MLFMSVITLPVSYKEVYKHKQKAMPMVAVQNVAIIAYNKLA